MEVQVILTPEVRKEKLINLTKNGQGQGTQKLHYKNETRHFAVYRIDLDWLIYNRHNGRLEAEMLTWEQEHSVSPDTYNDELHKIIDDLLWNSSVAKNEQTLKDLADKQQQRPGIVSLDGVIIDGNRRAMLLRRLERTKGKQYLDAIILPDAYDENQKEIVRLETQYQLGEDAKVEYGPLQKYLHARRLRDLDIGPDEIDALMGEPKGNAARLLEIMELMDDYLEHIGCPRLYTMLKDDGGTKEGMFVDLHSDLKRLSGGNHKIPWSFDPDVDPLQLRAIQFDYMRLGDFPDAKKSYREISHQSKGNNFFANKEIWEKFSEQHQENVDAVTTEMGTLEEFLQANPSFATKEDAARNRDNVWRERVKEAMYKNFADSSYSLTLKNLQLKPAVWLKRAKDAIEKVDVEGEGFLNDPDVAGLVMDINRKTYEMKKRLERAGRPSAAAP